MGYLNRFSFRGSLLVFAILGLVACAGPAGPVGPQGDPGPQGASPSESEIEHLVQDALVGEHANVESVARGGRLYDKWWTETGAEAPTEDHPLWELQTTNSRGGDATWRCKECHAWDYKGSGGTYSSGSHFTGFPGVVQAGATLSKSELLDALQGSTDYRHDFSSVLADEDLDDLANFLGAGLINDTQYFDYNTPGIPPLNPDLSNGKTLFSGTCTTCHADDGKQIVIAGEFGIGDIARNEPTVEILHKIRSGQPGTEMPSAIVNGWSVQYQIDVLGYVRSLP